MKEIFSPVSIMMMIISAIISILGVIVLFLLKRNKTIKTNYDFQNQKAELEKIGQFLDRQMNSINQILTVIDKKWSNIPFHINGTSKDDIILNDQKHIRINKFLEENGIKESDFVVDKNLIFLLTPFSSETNRNINILEKICGTMKVNIIKREEGNTTPLILRKILKSNLIVANVNHINPNVFYELGIAHALNKPTILIVKKEHFSLKPFEIHSGKFLIYSNLHEMAGLFKKELEKFSKNPDSYLNS